MPFSDQYVEKSLQEQISTASFSFKSKNWQKVSEPAKDLIKKLIVVDAKKRLSADQAIKHAWLINDPDMKRKVQNIMGLDVGIDDDTADVNQKSWAQTLDTHNPMIYGHKLIEIYIYMK